MMLYAIIRFFLRWRWAAIWGLLMGSLPLIWFFFGRLQTLEDLASYSTIVGALIGLPSLIISVVALTGQRGQASLAAALRADELHQQFNSTDMRIMRGRAWEYVRAIEPDTAMLKQYAESWMTERVEMPAGVTEHTATDTWAVSIMIEFYVRLMNYLDAYMKAGILEQKDVSGIIGPFHWGYWRHYLLALGDVCEEFYRANPTICFSPPYFAGRLKKLDILFQQSNLASMNPLAKKALRP